MPSSAVSALPPARGPSPPCTQGMFLRAQLVQMAKAAMLERVILSPCPTLPKQPPQGSHGAGGAGSDPFPGTEGLGAVGTRGFTVRGAARSAPPRYF